jgi:hypothetical protein
MFDLQKFFFISDKVNANEIDCTSTLKTALQRFAEDENSAPEDILLYFYPTRGVERNMQLFLVW